MIERLIVLAVRRYVGGPARSWVFSAAAVLGYRFVRSRTGRREIVDIGGVGRGRKIVIEHVPETHATQLKAERTVKRAAKADHRQAKRQARAERRDRRRARRAARSERRAARSAAA
ncbi:MAG: hypothetical protein AAGD35_09730 [Actinomycetota bacterium]